MMYPASILVKNTLRVWAISSWRGATELIECFLQCGYGHLPPGALIMFCMEEVHGPRCVGVRALLVHFTNPFVAYRLLGRVFWCGCEFISFTTYNIYSNFEYIFPTPNHMHTLPYIVDEELAGSDGQQAGSGGQQA
jgi:hypothetical protein